jgi:hypothetical protein
MSLQAGSYDPPSRAGTHFPNSWPAPIERMAAAAVSRLPMFLHAEAASGIVLVAAAATALVWVEGSDFPFEEPLVTSAVDQFGRLVLACLDGLPRRIALFCSRSWFPHCAPRVR